MPRMPTVCLLMLATLVTGCAARRGHDKLIAEYTPGGKPVAVSAPVPASYILYRRGSVPGPGGNPPEEVTLRDLGRREPVGFSRGSNGLLLAVAGDDLLVLDEGSYAWYLVQGTEHDTPRRLAWDALETTTTAVLGTVLIVSVVAGAVGLAVLYAAAERP